MSSVWSLRDAVDAVRPQRRQVRHPHLLDGPLLDDRHPRHARRVVGPVRPHLPHEAVVDLEDDLQVPREHAPQHRDRPLLERLRHQRVIGVADGSPRQIPGEVPVEALLVDEDAHQLGDGDRRMGVVQLDRGAIGEAPQVRVEALEVGEDVGDRAGDEEVLLLEAELFPVLGVIVRVENFGDVLDLDLLFDGARGSRPR